MALVLAALTWDLVMRAWRRGVRRELAARGWQLDGDAVLIGGELEPLDTLYARLARGEREAVLRAWELEMAQRARDLHPVWSEDAARIFPRLGEGGVGLRYVLESPLGETPVTAEQLGVDEVTLRGRALTNLAARVPRPASLDAPVTLGEAAALVLVPGWLEAGQEVFAFVPDARTLRVAPRLDELDTTPSRALERLGERPLRVTRAGIGKLEG
jgi:hypothetical protein